MATYEFNLMFEVNNQKIQALQNFNNHKFNISAYNLAPDIHPTSCLHLKSTPPSTFPHIKLFGRGPNHQTQPKAESQIQNNFQDSEEKAKKKKISIFYYNRASAEKWWHELVVLLAQPRSTSTSDPL
jgi:hypothetical protein